MFFSAPSWPPLGGIFAVVFASCMLQWAALDLNCKLQIALGSAGPQRGAPDCSGQRRTSTGELPSGVGSDGPHPGASRAEWAAPDLSCQKKMTENMSANNVRINANRNVRKYVRKERRKICQKKYQKKCQKICQIRTSEDMSKEMSENMSKKNVRKLWQKTCHNMYVNRSV